jgi:hypothetical protein
MKKLIAMSVFATLISVPLGLTVANAGSSSSAASKYTGKHQTLVALKAGKPGSVPITEFSSSSARSSSQKH